MRVNQVGKAIARRDCEQRSAPRTPLALPILIKFDRNRYSALLCDLSCAGAKIESLAPLLVSMRLELQCGTICANAMVMWQRGSAYGIKFSQPICDRQLADQVSRLKAVVKRRKHRCSAGMSTIKLA